MINNYPTTRKVKVFWTASEKFALAERIEQLFFVVGGYSKMQACEKAQTELLPATRHRKVEFWSTLSKALDPSIEAAHLRRLQESGEGTPLADPLPASNTSGDSRAKPSFEAWLSQGVDFLAPLVAQLIRHPLVRAELDDYAAHQAAQQALEPVESTLNSWRPAHGDASSGKPRILIAGLLASQAGEVTKELADRVELKFWSTDESKEMLRILAKNCQVAVGVTNFISHSADSSLKSLAPKYVRYTGGVSKLKDKLREVALEALA